MKQFFVQLMQINLETMPVVVFDIVPIRPSLKGILYFFIYFGFHVGSIWCDQVKMNNVTAKHGNPELGEYLSGSTQAIFLYLSRRLLWNWIDQYSCIQLSMNTPTPNKTYSATIFTPCSPVHLVPPSGGLLNGEQIF